MTNRSFQIGTNAGSPVSTQTDVDDLIVLRSNFVPGNLYGWGSGSLGLGATNPKSSPVQLGSFTNWQQISCGYYSVFTIKTDGTLWAWGTDNSTYGSLGLGDIVNRSSPTQVGLLTNWKSVSNGKYTALATPGPLAAAIKTDGTLWTWGYNTYGQLGLGDVIHRSSPTQVGSLMNWKTVSCGFNYTVAIQTDGTLWSWGWNNSGQLGLGGDTANKSSPVQIGSLSTWQKVSASGYTFTQSIKNDGTLWAWGRSTTGALGFGDTTTTYYNPTQVGMLSNWQDVSSGGGGFAFASAIKTDGTLWSWGSNTYLQLQSGQDISSPVQVGLLTNWKSVSSGVSLISATKTDGTLWVFGDNTFGQLGLGDIVARSSPVQVGLLTNWKSVSVYGQVSIAQTYST